MRISCCNVCCLGLKISGIIGEIKCISYYLIPVFKKDNSPGPGYMVHPSITRYGKDGSASYSILGRQKDSSKSFIWNIHF